MAEDSLSLVLPPSSHKSQSGFSLSMDDKSVTETTEEVLKELQEAWQNEKFAPDLLVPKTELIDWLSSHISQMEESMSRLPKGSMVASIHLHELDRVKFVLNSYLRARLYKIQSCVVHLLEEEAQRPKSSPSKMTPNELIFAKEYIESVESHLKSTVMQFMPPNFQALDRKKTVQRPNMDCYVFCKAKEKLDDVTISPEEEADQTSVDFEENSQHLVQYRLIAGHLHNGTVKLI